MMQSQMMAAQRSNAIYGDANTQTATVVPDLAAAADGVNFSVQSDSSVLNVNQELVLQDFIYETTTEEVKSSINQPGHMAIVGNTMGWTDKEKMVLELDVNIKLTTKVPVNVEAAYVSIATAGNWDYIFDANPETVSKISMPSFNVLQPIENIIIQLGTNNQVIGRSQMNYLRGVKMIAQDCKGTPEEYRELAQIGSPVSRCVYQGNDQPNNSWRSMKFKEASNLPSEFLEVHSQIWRQIQEATQATYRRNVAPPGIITCKVGIPLKYINSFFKGAGYLPPGLPYRIEINYSALDHFFADWNKIANHSNDYRSAVYTISYNSLSSLIYRRHQLRQPAAAAIMNQWITRPFLYMYNTYEYVEIKTDGSTRVFNKDIAISQQRPTSIFIKVYKNNESDLYLNPVVRTLDLNDEPFGRRNIRDYKDSECCAIAFSNIRINIAGREQYNLKTPYVNQLSTVPFLNDGTGLLNNMINKNVDQEMDECSVFVSNMASDNEGATLQISINPGDFQKNGFISSDTGATVINLEFTCTNNTGNEDYKTIGTGYTIVVYKKLQEEIELDGVKKITTIQWPAVKSSANYLIQNTYNLN